jgi:hypothetical protein
MLVCGDEGVEAGTAAVVADLVFVVDVTGIMVCLRVVTVEDLTALIEGIGLELTPVVAVAVVIRTGL